MIEINESLSILIGRQLKARRKEVFPGDTQRDTALRLGIGVSTYSRMERGDDRVSLRHYLEAARVLRCKKSFHALFVESDVKEGLIAQCLREYREKEKKNKSGAKQGPRRLLPTD